MRRWIVLFVIGIALGVGGGALADEKDAEREARIEALKQKGLRHYDLAEYDEAIAAFKEMYRLDPKPAYLYTIAQAYRLKGDCEQAYAVYKNFARLDPEGAKRGKVDQRIEEMERCRRERAAADGDRDTDTTPSTTTTTSPATITVPTMTSLDERDERDERDEPRRDGRGKKVAGLVTIGTGVLLAGAGIYFAVDAAAKADEIDQAYADRVTWNDDLAAIESDGRRAELFSIVLLSAGGAALLTGGILYYLGVRDAREGGATVGIAPGRGGAGLTVSWGF